MTRILGPTDRATIRERWRGSDFAMTKDVLALLDTCDAMESCWRLWMSGWRPENGEWVWGWDHSKRRPVSPAEAAVLDTTRQDPTHG